jgi:zinc-finger of transposase IS204/IS1001/IS1096/IS1165
MTRWVPGPGIEVLEAKNLNGSWIVNAVGRGSGRCPACESLSTSHHSRYVRHLQDLPAQGAAVALSVTLNRWRCRNKGCEQRAFSDLILPIAQPFARRTCRVSELAYLVGHSAWGRPAERLMKRLGLPQSDDTILRHLKRHQAERGGATPVRVAGIDDWSWRKSPPATPVEKSLVNATITKSPVSWRRSRRTSGVVDDAPITAAGLRLPIRMTVIRLANGALLLHSPTRHSPAPQAQLQRLSEIK